MSARQECTTCIKRRIRCDGLKPNCQRCQKAQRMCIFPDAASKSFVFVGSNTRVTKPKRRSGVVSNPQVLADTNHGDGFQMVQWQPPPTPALVPSLADQATAYYFHAHHGATVEFIEPAREHSSLLPEAFARTGSQSSLRLALQARSHAAFGKARHDALVSQESSRLYVQAVKLVRQSLADPVAAASDEVLLATMVLSSFENTLAFDADEDVKGLAPALALSQRMVQGFRHHDGATALLKFRKQHPASPNDLNLDKLVRRQVLRSALLRGCGIPDFLELGEYFGESGVTLGLDRHMAQLIKGQRYARLMRNYYLVAQAKGQPLNKDPLLALINEAQRLDNDMVAWARRLGPDWSYETINLSVSHAVYPRTEAHSYKSLGHEAIWNRHRTVRIISKRVSIDLLRLAEEFFNDQCELSIHALADEIRSLIDGICASSVLTHEGPEKAGTSLPFLEAEAEEMLNATKLAHFAFPLHAVVESFPYTGLPISQEHWIRDRLYGVGKAGNDTLLQQIALRPNGKNLSYMNSPG